LLALTAATNNTRLIRNRDYEYRTSKDLLTQIKRRASSLLLLGRFHTEFLATGFSAPLLLSLSLPTQTPNLS
jgi:hypothetical protein